VSAVEISVIVPFLDAERYLERCIRGLLDQRFDAAAFEILMIDNGSSDRSAEIVRRHPRIRLLDEPRRGAYAARNRGLREARGRLIAFTDPDCVPGPQWLTRLAAAMRDSAVQVVMGRDRPVGDSRAVRLVGTYHHVKEAHLLSGSDATRYHGHTNNLIARRELFARLGPFDERRRGSDTIFVQRVLAEHGTDAVRYAPDAVVDHLEVDGIRVWLRKMFLYGRSTHLYADLVVTQPPNARDRAEIFRRTVREARMGRLDATLLATLLGAGVVCWHAGRIVAALRPAAAEPELARLGASR
jgi:glycosyltransferase involved in cell wall biosynthesis